MTSMTDFTHSFGVSIVDFEQVNTCLVVSIYPTNIYLFKFNHRYSRKRCEIYSKLTIKAPERRHWHISHLFLMFLSLTLNKSVLAGIEVISFAVLYLATFTLTLTAAVYYFDGYYHHSLSRFIFSNTVMNALQ